MKCRNCFRKLLDEDMSIIVENHITSYECKLGYKCFKVSDESKLESLLYERDVESEIDRKIIVVYKQILKSHDGYCTDHDQGEEYVTDEIINKIRIRESVLLEFSKYLYVDQPLPPVDILGKTSDDNIIKYIKQYLLNNIRDCCCFDPKEEDIEIQSINIGEFREII
jgi:hypothetical protein